MTIQTHFPTLDALFDNWKTVIGNDFPGYRNHVYRMVNFCLQLRDCNEDERHKIFIAGVFHDIGIWTDNTIDYLDPSVDLAKKYLAEIGKEDWQEEVGLMISEHHKLRSAEDHRYPLVEVFRQADLVDFSLGLFKCGLDPAIIREARSKIPNAGFHPMLVRRASAWFIRHPLNPAPMMKW